MERLIGTVSRGIRGPIIRQGDDLVVTDLSLTTKFEKMKMLNPVQQFRNE